MAASLGLPQQGLLSIRDLWMKAQGYSLLRDAEPPCVDPLAGWCGRGIRENSPDPD
ncbi:MAG: hypothetical protein GVY04_23765 [Cyanobacteria bacterium]|nr:hypothetical protein [Cyanobacteria bacterium GSL.Bin1]